MMSESPHKKSPLPLIALAIVAAVLAVVLLQPRTPDPEAGANLMFYGVQQVAAEDIHTLMPEAQDRPLLLEFTSKYCKDCKRMAPVLKETLTHYDHIVFEHVDIMKDKKSQATMIETFQPSVVPVLLFITPSGDIQNVLYGYQDSETLSAELDKLGTGNITPKAEG